MVTMLSASLESCFVVPFSGAIDGCSFWLPFFVWVTFVFFLVLFLGAIFCMGSVVPFLDAVLGCRSWMPVLDAVLGCH